ncbi:DNA-binding IclR family transcriptional regulator [Deinobacterium chartae]|uniref:DNA-binding IclR family transcriptional regulator n=1 Tax=Deinobacterium chartae TaxID=521158 RepID=A0A841I2I0_9DEIO|nr:IclR family transcriptional regulator [Deinobacterium chartae]MBB6098589.1 DNA-binding IclR family transcriptional regulator [Deinobacterium chartae]
MTQAAKDPARYLIQSAANTLEVLIAFGQPPHRFTPSEIAALLRIDRNQAFRCLRTLQHTGFVRLDEDDRFVLTPLVGKLAVAAEHQPSLAAVAPPFLDEVLQATEESVNLFVLSGTQMVCVDHRDSPRAVRLASVLGSRVPLHAGACPKAALAFLEPELREQVLEQLPELPRYTPHTLGTRAELEAEIERTRARGYSISDQDYDLEARGAGAPIFNAEGKVVGAISVGGPSFRVSLTRLEQEFVPVLLQVARLISRQLGYLASPLS